MWYRNPKAERGNIYALLESIIVIADQLNEPLDEGIRQAQETRECLPKFDKGWWRHIEDRGKIWVYNDANGIETKNHG